MYPDANAKPELLCALTEFEALCGVRPVDATSLLLDEIGADGLAGDLMATGPGPSPRRHRTADGSTPAPTVAACSTSSRPEAVLGTTVEQDVPRRCQRASRPSSSTTSFSQPGEAIHLTAGNLHAYLHGSGVELMGASDNVVRGGLTVKPVDVDELLRVVDPTPLGADR